VSQLKYLGTTAANQNLIQEEIKSRLKSGNACYHSVQPEGKRPLGGSRCRWVDNIKMDLVGIRWGVVDWIGLTQDMYKRRVLVNAVMNLWVPLNMGKLSSGYTTGGLSCGTQPHRVS
jgi:hypothetical protein